LNGQGYINNMASDDDKIRKGIVVHATIPITQYKMIKELEGMLGTSENGVVSNIIQSWLYDQEWFKEKISKKIGGKE
jgi:hypothetical protein